MATSYSADQTNWLNRDLLSQTEKNTVDIDLSSQLAKLLRDRTAYEQQNQQGMTEAQRAGNDLYRQVAESYAARGLSSSTPYLQADDRAFQGVQTQLGDLRSQLADYQNNYDAANADARLKAEQQKRAIEAEALQRYAQRYVAGIGG